MRFVLSSLLFVTVNLSFANTVEPCETYQSYEVQYTDENETLAYCTPVRKNGKITSCDTGTCTSKIGRVCETETTSTSEPVYNASGNLVLTGMEIIACRCIPQP